MSIQTLQNNKKLYKFTYKDDEKKQLIKMMKYDGDLLFNGILPLDLEVKILKYNNYEYNYETKEIINPMFNQIKHLDMLPIMTIKEENDWCGAENKDISRMNQIEIRRFERYNPRNNFKNKQKTFISDLYRPMNIFNGYFRDKSPSFRKTLIKKYLLTMIQQKYNIMIYSMDCIADYEVDLRSVKDLVDDIKRFAQDWERRMGNRMYIGLEGMKIIKKVPKMNNEELYKFLISDY
tara:strand:+ start:2877 stop:3581 length:705 start_codon:yes stop_codon:yes gene_type:complete